MNFFHVFLKVFSRIMVNNSLKTREIKSLRFRNAIKNEKSNSLLHITFRD